MESRVFGKIRGILNVLFGILIISGWFVFNSLYLYKLQVYSYSMPAYYAISASILPLSIILIMHGIRILQNIRKSYTNRRYPFPKTIFYFFFIIFTVICFPLAIIYGIDMFLINFTQLISDAGYEGYFASLMLWIGSLAWFIFVSVEMIANVGWRAVFISKYNEKRKRYPALTVNERISHLERIGRIQGFIIISILIGAMCSVGGVYISGNQRCEFFKESSFSAPAYEIPSGIHFNTSLDSLSGDNASILSSLEKAMWKFTTIQRAGGFPLGSSLDGSLMWSDRGKLCPLMEGEFSIQGGTPPVGEAYLKMYQLEPDPIYLSVAEDAAEALIAVQDNQNGGFYHEGRRFPDGSGYQPHTHNARRAAVLDDNTMQSALTFLLHMYNETGRQDYLNALNRGFDCILEMEIPGGGWPQKSNYGKTAFQNYVTLNDNAMYDVVFLFLEAYSMYPERTDLFEAAISAGQFLIRVQGNGGSETQKGWAQQYNRQNQPAWARSFEPPAICASQTARAIDILTELYIYTGNISWLDPIPAAIEWLNSSETKLDDNKWARLYELKTNKPIYGIERGGPYQNPQYVYNLEDARPGYSWEGNAASYTMAKWLKLVDLGYDIDAYNTWRNTPPSIDYLQSRANGAMDSLNEDGWWLAGDEIIDSVFSRNTDYMIDYLERIIS